MRVFISSNNDNRMFRQPVSGTPIDGINGLEAFVNKHCQQFILKESNTAMKSRGKTFFKDVTLSFTSKRKKCLFLIHYKKLEPNTKLTTGSDIKDYQWIMEIQKEKERLTLAANSLKELINIS